MVDMENKQMTLTNSQLEVAETILEQLGGRKFIAMTGARDISGLSSVGIAGECDGLSFKLPGGGGFTKNGINYVKITLTPDDTYTMTFLRIRGTKIHDVEQHHGVYCDQLQTMFTSVTGLAVSL
jgi:hypothetical protein